MTVRVDPDKADAVRERFAVPRDFYYSGRFRDAPRIRAGQGAEPRTKRRGG